MSEVITYVGIDAHKKDLFVAMLIGAGEAPGHAGSWRTSRMRCGGWCGSSSGKLQGRCGRVTRRARADMRCSAR